MLDCMYHIFDCSYCKSIKYIAFATAFRTLKLGLGAMQTHNSLQMQTLETCIESRTEMSVTSAVLQGIPEKPALAALATLIEM